DLFGWDRLASCAATVVAISLVGTVSALMAVVLTPVAVLMIVALFRLAAAGQSLHHDFADKAAAVDGEMVDVITNMPLVWSFCGLRRGLRGGGVKVGPPLVCPPDRRVLYISFGSRRCPTRRR